MTAVVQDQAPLVTAVCKALRARRAAMSDVLRKLDPAVLCVREHRLISEALKECMEHDANTIESLGRRL